uniref:Uncharacterized protein n=1 Tax=Neogobius melanostomus TaxID=47308 RepID=A0A8C6S176_9GOBI
MPRGKGFRRSFAAKQRRAEQLTRPSSLFFSCAFEVRVPGDRHIPNVWPKGVSKKQHRLVIPALSPNKKLVLLVGNSHLRAVVENVVPMPQGGLSFAISATPGGCASHIQAELAGTVLPRDPALVCVMATCNNGFSRDPTRTVDQAAREFGQLLAYVCGRWPKVSTSLLHFMLTWRFRPSFSRRLRYFPVAQEFPLTSREMWAKDGTHLSDSHGMPILVKLLWNACYMQLELDVAAAAAAAAQASPPPRRPVTRRVSPRMEVPEVLPVPPPPPPEYTEVRRGSKVRMLQFCYSIFLLSSHYTDWSFCVCLSACEPQGTGG